MKKSILFFFVLLYVGVITAQKNNEQPVITKIILLRHAEKVGDGSKDPALTEEGEQRAERLRFLLSDVAIDNVFSSPYVRTKGTVSKLAVAKNIEIKIYDPKDAQFSEYLLRHEKGKTSVVVGHSNSIPTLVNRLIKKEQYQSLSEDVYDKLWIITFSDATLVDCSVYHY
ncbi:histidine phosphatase family protein [Flavobacterium sp. J27]|uniref:SixA phosphatase family protein n=1 Tax=Flavobacterium sp. J27 TaxID=2060419 RepID=UPI001032514C|nr:phosphoglycerate mutase family protein [Flavobacterium sp. J27]